MSELRRLAMNAVLIAGGRSNRNHRDQRRTTYVLLVDDKLAACIVQLCSDFVP
jgi:hypothetical protein